jgi:NAD-dependent SIR2 family protein deacetylase
MGQSLFIEAADSLLRPELEELVVLVARARCLVALTGAGVSTESGIPDYRDERGEWKRTPPLRYQEFVGSDRARRRYWARAMAGFPALRDAEPGRAHRALARLEESGRLHHLITQNVDGLHQKAGARKVSDLHGRLDRVQCLNCREVAPRDEYQDRLEKANPAWLSLSVSAAPDGDADLEDADYAGFHVPACSRCSGVLKPDVVFFGESVPRERVGEVFSRVDEADLLLVAGSSLMVWSGYRFVRRARERGIEVAVINLGRTRADGEVTLKLQADCGETLEAVASRGQRLKPPADRS